MYYPAFVFAAILPIVLASSGTTVPLTLYTDIQCTTIDAVTPNISLSLNTCAITVGLGSVTVPFVPCAQGNANLWVFDDTSCVNQDIPLDLGNNCVGRMSQGSWGSIMLNCDPNEPGTAAATTTIDLGVALAATAGPSSSSSPTSTNATTLGSGDNKASWWDSLSTGAKTGLIIGCAVGFFVLLAVLERFGNANRRRRTGPDEPVIYTMEQVNPTTRRWETVHYEITQSSSTRLV